MVGSEPTSPTKSAPRCMSHRPLMVGSELFILPAALRDVLVAVPSWSGRNWKPSLSEVRVADCHRPLMVGSELIVTARSVRFPKRSPSPHGRVGTSTRRHCDVHCSPSRRPLMVGSELVPWVRRARRESVAVPSWSGRNINAVLKKALDSDPSPSPHGRVGTTASFLTLTRLLTGRRPLMVGSERKAFSNATDGRSNVAVPSWSGRNCVSDRHVGGESPSPSPHGRVGTSLKMCPD